MYSQSIQWKRLGTVMVGRFNAPRSPLEIITTISPADEGRWLWSAYNITTGLSTVGEYASREEALNACEREAKHMTTRACGILSDTEISRRRSHERMREGEEMNVILGYTISSPNGHYKQHPDYPTREEAAANCDRDAGEAVGAVLADGSVTFDL